MTRPMRPIEARPLAVRADTAASLLGISETLFLEWVKDGRMPKPVKPNGINGVALYDFEAVKSAWENLRDQSNGTKLTGWDRTCAAE